MPNFCLQILQSWNENWPCFWTNSQTTTLQIPSPTRRSPLRRLQTFKPQSFKFWSFKLAESFFKNHRRNDLDDGAMHAAHSGRTSWSSCTIFRGRFKLEIPKSFEKFKENLGREREKEGNNRATSLMLHIVRWAGHVFHVPSTVEPASLIIKPSFSRAPTSSERPTTV